MTGAASSARTCDLRGMRTHKRYRVIRDLGTLEGTSSEAIAINGRGQTIGSFGAPDRGHRGAFLWQDGEIPDLGRLSGLHAARTSFPDMAGLAEACLFAAVESWVGT